MMDRFRVTVACTVECEAVGYDAAAELAESILKGDRGKPDHTTIEEAEAHQVVKL